jgi:hypothetical protein
MHHPALPAKPPSPQRSLCCCQGRPGGHTARGPTATVTANRCLLSCPPLLPCPTFSRPSVLFSPPSSPAAAALAPTARHPRTLHQKAASGSNPRLPQLQASCPAALCLPSLPVPPQPSASPTQLPLLCCSAPVCPPERLARALLLHAMCPSQMRLPQCEATNPGRMCSCGAGGHTAGRLWGIP